MNFLTKSLKTKLLVVRIHNQLCLTFIQNNNQILYSQLFTPYTFAQYRVLGICNKFEDLD